MASRRRAAQGQHFLTDGRIVHRILDAAAPGPEDTVLEVGPGHGALTGPLLQTGARLVAVEKDLRLVDELARRFAGLPRLRLHPGDATRIDLASLGPFTKIVSNLPYSVSTPLTFRFLDLPFRQAILMYQREFAQRMAAPPGSRTYGRLTAAVAYHAAVEPLFAVAPGAFRPPPRVGSMVVRLVPHPRPPFDIPSVEAYRHLLRVTFTSRRKTLRATLRRTHAELGIRAAEDAIAVVEALGWADRRPETLAPADFGLLSRALQEAVDDA